MLLILNSENNKKSEKSLTLCYSFLVVITESPCHKTYEKAMIRTLYNQNRSLAMMYNQNRSPALMSIKLNIHTRVEI